MLKFSASGDAVTYGRTSDSASPTASPQAATAPLRHRHDDAFDGSPEHHPRHEWRSFRYPNGPSTRAPTADRHSRTLTHQIILRLRDRPTNPSTVYQGTFDTGVLKTDGGAHWTSRKHARREHHVVDLVVNPATRARWRRRPTTTPADLPKHGQRRDVDSGLDDRRGSPLRRSRRQSRTRQPMASSRASTAEPHGLECSPHRLACRWATSPSIRRTHRSSMSHTTSDRSSRRQMAARPGRR